MSKMQEIGQQSRLLPATAFAAGLERFPLGSVGSRAAARSLVAARQQITKLGPFASLVYSLPPLSRAEAEALRQRIIAARARVAGL
jgi:hypothetical protein